MRYSRKLGCALATSTCVWMAPAMAAALPDTATTPQASAPASSEGTVDDKAIVVTAQRRRENVQNVNIAITAVTGEGLADKKVVRELDLQNIAPGLSIVKAGLTESINIRGIGLASGSPQVTNGVSTYLDGVFQPPIVSGGQFYDIAGVEVLRGPQGTLVGANSTGGAVYINTNKPVLGKLGGSVTMSAGNYTNLAANAALNLPITPTLALRVAGLDNVRDSYYRDLGTAHDTPDRLSEQDGRVQLLWKPGNFQALAKVETVRRNTGGYAYQPISTTEYSAGRTGIPWTVDYNSPTSNFERALITSLEMKYQFDSGLTIRSQTAYLNKRINNQYDVDGSTLAQLGQNQFVRERQYSQEINVISPDTGRLTYVLGGYAQRNKVNVRIFNTTNGSPTLWIEPDTDKLLLGVFGQATYKLSDKWQIEAGARYSHFHVDGTGGVYVGRTATSQGINVASQVGSEGDGRMTGKVALNFKPNKDNLLYIFAARGYKNGGINPPGGTFKPETVWDYEAGWKSAFFDRRVHTQIGAFYNDYKNFQEDIINQASGSSGVTNLANATIKGFEASFQAKFADLSFDGGLSFVDSSMSRFTLIDKWQVPAAVSGYPQCNGSNAARCYDYTSAIITSNGGPNLFSPKWTWNINAQYRIHAGHDIDVVPRIGYSYVGSQWAYVTYTPATDLINAHGLLQASVAVEHGALRVEAYGTNLLNSYYVAGQSGLNEFYGAPREYGVRVSASF